MDIKNLKRLLATLIILLVVLSGFYYKYVNDKNAQRFYSQGKSLYEQGKYSDAYYNFKQIKPIAKNYELALLKQYQCAQKLDDKKTALIKLKELTKTTKNEYIKPWALYNEAILSQELKLDNQTQSYRKFNSIQLSYKDNDFAIASAYKSAQLSKESTPNQSKASFIKYLSYAPMGKYSISSLEELKQINSYFSNDDYEIIADSYLANSKFQSAIEYYNKTLFSKNWYKISKCYKGLNDKKNEKESILKGLSLKDSEIDEKELSHAIDRLISFENNKLQTLQNLYTKYQNSYAFATITYKLAEASSSIRAIKLYDLVVNDYPNSIWASNALWEVFWYEFQQGRYKTCEKLAKRHLTLYSKTQDSPRIAYWLGRVLLKNRKTQQAREIFYNVINDYPLSYYSFLSARQLKMSKAKKMIVKKAIANYDKKNLNKEIFKNKTLLELANIGDWELIDEFKIDNEFVKSWVAYQKGNYPIAINFAKEELIGAKKDSLQDDDEEEATISFDNQMLKLVYPIFYENEINHWAQEFKQSPYLFLSLVREESHFNQNAKSPVGALGLSQLMNSTASFIENKPISKEILLEPNENIRIGLKYFTYLMNYFKNNEYLAILAYNAGPGNINKWLNDSNIKSDEIDIFVENIPYLETKNYIKKILSSYWIYLNIYSTKHK